MNAMLHRDEARQAWVDAYGNVAVTDYELAALQLDLASARRRIEARADLRAAPPPAPLPRMWLVRDRLTPSPAPSASATVPASRPTAPSEGDGR